MQIKKYIPELLRKVPDLVFMKKLFGFVFLILILSEIIIIRYGHILSSDSNKFLDIWGDGFKNYATVLYHVKHDSTYMHFDGMNYPYGEHVLFTDNQPLISNTLKFINNHFFDVYDSIVPVIHYSMLASLLLAGIFLFLIFQKFSLPNWYNISITTGLVFLSPQILRLGGHFGLAHAFVIPLFIYLLMLFEERKSWKLSIVTGILVILIAQIHFYYFGIIALLIAFYFLFRLLQSFCFKDVKFYGFHFFLQIIIPFIVLKIWISIGNNVTDRPNAPYGFLSYIAYWESIFVKPDISFFKWIDMFVIKIRKVPYEGKAYIGIISTLTFFTFIIKWIFGKFKKPFWNFRDNDKKPFLDALFKTSIVLLLFSGGFPFIIPGLEGLVEYLGPLKQLRSIGRFAWAFYYIINILVFVYLFNLIKTVDKKKYHYIFLIFLIFFLLNDAANLSINKKVKLREIPELSEEFKKSDKYWFKDIDISKYQAILPIPYFHLGSENFGYHAKGTILTTSLTASILTGLPNMGVMMSRTSLSQTVKSIQMLLEPYRTIDILEDLPNKKPLLVLIDKEGLKNQRLRNYSYIIDNCPKLFENDKIIIQELQLELFEKNNNLRKNYIINELYSKKLFKIGNILSKDSITNFVYKDFHENKSVKYYFTKGSFTGISNKENVVFQGKLPYHKKGEKFLFETWIYTGEDRYPRITCKFKEYDPLNPETEYQYKHLGLSYEMKAIDRDWTLFEFSFYIKNPNSEIVITFQNPGNKNNQFWIDEMLIRPANAELYKTGDDFIWKNIRYYRKEKK